MYLKKDHKNDSALQSQLPLPLRLGNYRMYKQHYSFRTKPVKKKYGSLPKHQAHWVCEANTNNMPWVSLATISRMAIEDVVLINGHWESWIFWRCLGFESPPVGWWPKKRSGSLLKPNAYHQHKEDTQERNVAHWLSTKDIESLGDNVYWIIFVISLIQLYVSVHTHCVLVVMLSFIWQLIRRMSRWSVRQRLYLCMWFYQL